MVGVDEFAMNAPEVIPEWFIRTWSKDNKYNLSLYNAGTGRLTDESEEELYFAWRWYYAKKMMKAIAWDNKL